MIRNYLKLSMLIAFVAGILSCNKGFDNSEDEQKIIENEQAIEKYAADSSITIVKDTSGLYYSITPNPTGVKLALGDEATIRYNAYLLNGTKVWTSEKDTAKSIKYPFFTGYRFVVPGMELALRLMRTGEKAKVFLPYYLGFSGNSTTILTGYSKGSVPEYSPVRVDIELIGKRSEIQQINDFIVSNKLVVTERTSDNLVLVKTTSVAAGDTIGSGKTVNVKYVGKFLNGTVFDPGTKPLSFVTGTGRNTLITGFDRAIRKLKTGEKATIVLPSALAYSKGLLNSTQSDFVIRPYQPIAFDVEVL